MLDIDFSNIPKDEIEEYYKSISLKVRYFREKKNMTQLDLDLALDIGIKSVAFYSNCENNRYGKHFNLEHLYKIAKTLDMNIKDFL
ncbi:MAG: helix-turn-helix domain-containing protein [Sulfurimonas sp.]|nr:helix-turn-helix domain-containing protein [Sulfurimonas sp.]